MPRLGTPTGTIEVLHKYNFNFQKKFGQNFLIEPGVLETIVEAAEIGEEDCVLEIGPGIGTMTQYLAEQAGEVIAVEIDKALIPILKDTLSAYTNVTVINADILKLDVEELYATMMEYREMIAPYVCDTSAYLDQAIKDGKNILLEGQLGTLKDPDHGIYPMVTSSSTLAAYGAIGAGIPPYEIKQVITVCKAYSSAVGAGAFVSEIFGEEADELRRRGGGGGE